MRSLVRVGWAASGATLVLLVAAPCLLPLPAMASGAGPGGVNIGFDFNWNPGPTGYAASFIATVSGSGASLEDCDGPLNVTPRQCNFPISYSIGGVPQIGVSSGGSYYEWTGTCLDNGVSAPLTLFNCFNANSFGQLFTASATGALSNLTMQMTCLNPAGTPITGLTALIYLSNSAGSSIGATPLAQVPVDLTTCPTLTSWTTHTFVAGDFAAIPLNFTGVTLTSGNVYGVFFGGLVPGATLPGSQSPPATPAPPSFWLAVVGLGAAAFLALWRRRLASV